MKPSGGNGNKSATDLVKTAVLLAVLCAAIFFIARHSLNSDKYAVTDDAYITGHPHIISSRIDGVVEEVTVDDNDPVKRGETLVRLDPHDYKVALERAEAKLAVAKRSVNAARDAIDFNDKHAQAQQTSANGAIENAKALVIKEQDGVVAAKEAVDAAKFDLAQATAQLKRSKLDYDRYIPLEQRGVISTHEKDLAVRDYEVAKSAQEGSERRVREATAKLQEAQQSVIAAKAILIKAQSEQTQAESDRAKTEVASQQYQVSTAAVQAAQAEVDDAKLKLDYCNVYSPVTGHVGKRTVEVGHHIDPGQQLITVVEDYVWVVANYKETQIRKMHIGQAVSVRVDGVPDHVFTGIVDSFSPGSGSTFSLIPPDNATGNFTKIVQRIPVKIRFDPASTKGYEDKLIVGMSVEATVNLDSSPQTTQLAKQRNMDNPLKKIMPYFW